jgi:hypothetical protein
MRRNCLQARGETCTVFLCAFAPLRELSSFVGQNKKNESHAKTQRRKEEDEREFCDAPSVSRSSFIIPHSSFYARLRDAVFSPANSSERALLNRKTP